MIPVSLLVAYLIGGIPLGLILCKLWKGVDPRDVGSGNIGATNISRILGPAGGVLVFALDVGKGYLSVWLATLLAGASGGYWLPVGAAIAALMGNNFPVWLKFKGGKGASISLGIGIAVAWKVALAAFVIWVIAALLTRYISVASIAAVAFTPLLTIDLEPRARWPSLLAFTAGVAALVIYKHRANIQRLRAGTEPKVQFGKKKANASEEA
jgi:glycerol-3-phosphate acyltransferase PlsY